MKIPIIAREVKIIKSFQFINSVVTDKSPIKPMIEFTAIINKEVPTAIFMGNLHLKTKAGIIKNPPPAPTKPVNNPKNNP